jgi:hypothetical protein
MGLNNDMNMNTADLATLGLAIAVADDADYTVGKSEKVTTFSVAMAF